MDFIISRRASIVFLASGGDRLFFSEIISVIAFLVRVNGFAPVLLTFLLMLIVVAC